MAFGPGVYGRWAGPEPFVGRCPSAALRSLPAVAASPAQLLCSGSRAPSWARLWPSFLFAARPLPLKTECLVGNKTLGMGTFPSNVRTGPISTTFSVFLYSCCFQRFPDSLCFPFNERLNAPGKRTCGRGGCLCFLER